MDKNINILISDHEVDVLQTHTLITHSLINKLISAIQGTKQKKTKIQRVKISCSIKDLDKIISFIADKANQKNSSDDVQYILDNMFGRFTAKLSKLCT